MTLSKNKVTLLLRKKAYALITSFLKQFLMGSKGHVLYFIVKSLKPFSGLSKCYEGRYPEHGIRLAFWIVRNT